MNEQGTGERIDAAFIGAVCERLAAGKRVRRRLPGGGRLHIDRQLPFLCVHRDPAESVVRDTAGLITGEAAFLIAPRAQALHADLQQLVAAIADVMSTAFGAFLLIELWAGRGGADPLSPPKSASVRRPTFRVLTGSLDPGDATIRELARALAEIPLRPASLEVEVRDAAAAHPEQLPQLLAPHRGGTGGRHTLALEVQPVFRQARTGTSYPAVYRALRDGLSIAIRQTAYHFALTHSTHTPAHYHAFGRRTAVRAAAEVDQALTEISHSFDFLLQVTPVNAAGAFAEFERGGFDRAPAFDYRPLVVDVDAVKRRLYDLPIEELEDPTLAHLLRDCREELDRKITMLGDRETPRFLYGSLALYGPVDPALRAVALDVLAQLQPGDDHEHSADVVDAVAFAARAEAEIAWYRSRHPAMAAQVHVRNDVSGLLVSKGDLLIGSRLRIAAGRAEALLQHEVGTHVVTYYNGLAQPLGQLASGLAGYEELQEGLAVLAEHLAGALTVSRLRLLAGRVIAVHHLVDGASFVETFRALADSHGFSGGEAFQMCLRVYRSGGLTKDAIYLRGLLQLLQYLREDGDLEPLLLGKVALSHVPALRELRWREYLRPPPLRPRHLDTSAARERLAHIRSGSTIMDLAAGTVSR